MKRSLFIITLIAGTLIQPAAHAQSTSAGVVAAAAGEFHSLFVRADGGLWAVGRNQYRQLGDGTTVERSSPIFVASGVVAVAAGTGASFYLTADGTLMAVGENFEGSLGNGSRTANTLPAVVATGVVAVSHRFEHTVFIKKDGSLWAMGTNAFGQLGTGNNTAQLFPIKVASDVVEASAGDNHTLFRTADRRLWGMGHNGQGQLGLGTTTPEVSVPTVVAANVISLAAGGWDSSNTFHSLFVTSDQSAWSMGSNSTGQLGVGGNALRRSPVKMADQVTQVRAGFNFSLLIKANGSLWGMGDNATAHLGLGNQTDQTVPIQIIPTDVVSASAGRNHVLVVKSGGALWGMGQDDSNRLGLAEKSGYYNIPTLILQGPVAPAPAPTSLLASDGLTPTLVRLNWTPSLGATYYEVWRGLTDSVAQASLLSGRVESPLYYDTTAESGVAYRYWVRAVNPGGFGAFSASDVGSVAQVPASWLSNVSVRTAVAASQEVIVGFTVQGAPLDVLIRAIGPSLTGFGVPGAMTDPVADLYQGTTKVLSNDNWVGSLAPTFARVGAFPLPVGSRDSAMVQPMSGGYTVQVRGTGAGVVLVEGYDVTGIGYSRLTNLSARNRTTAGDGLLIAGFTITGTGQKRLLVRGVGPTLASFGVPGTLGDPKLALFRSNGTRIDENDNWIADHAPVFASVGAFPFPAGSKDAALVVTLDAGASYTVQVSDVNGTPGEALIEVYELP